MDERRLGRGLRSLLAPSDRGTQEETDKTIPIDRVEPGKLQPRGSISDEGIKSLSRSIRDHGLLQPIVVRRKGGSFEIVAGERRWRAAKLAGLSAVPVKILEDVGDEKALELALVENIQREDLDPISRAKALRQLVEGFGLTQDQVASTVGLDRSTVANAVRLLDLPEEVQGLVSRGTLSGGHARAILAAADPGVMESLAARAIRERLSVRRIEELARESAPGVEGKLARRIRTRRLVPWVGDLESRLTERLGCRVIVHSVGRQWKVLIHCSDEAEVRRVTDSILGLKPEPEPRETSGHPA